MHLVVGATGLLGMEICRRMVDAGKPVKALVRPSSNPARLEELRGLGVSLVEGDLKDPTSLEAACRGVRAVLSTVSSTFSRQPGDSIRTVDRDGQLSLVDAAESAGVRQFVFISFRKNPELHYPLDDAKRMVERRLKESGLTYTILQAGYFMEVWLSPALGFEYPNARARIFGDGNRGVSWVSFKDVATMAAASLDDPAAHNAVIEVGGPEALSPLEVVRIFEEVGGEAFAVEHVPEEPLRAQKDGAADPLQESFAALMLACADGDAIEMDATLEAFPMQLTTVRDYAKGVLAEV